MNGVMPEDISHIIRRALKEEIALVTGPRLKSQTTILPNEGSNHNEERDQSFSSISSEVGEEEEGEELTLSDLVTKELLSTTESSENVDSSGFSYSQGDGSAEDRLTEYSPSELDIAVLKSYLTASENTILEHSNAFISRYYDKIVEECESKSQRLMPSDDHSALHFILKVANMDETEDGTLSTKDEICDSEIAPQSLPELQLHNTTHATDENQISEAVPSHEDDGEREIVHEYFTNWRSIIGNAQLRAVLIDLITLARAELELEEAEQKST